MLATTPTEKPVGTSGTGLDKLVTLITNHKGLNACIPPAEIFLGAAAVDAMNLLIVEAIHATGVANDGTITTADVRDLNSYVQLNYAQQWAELHGDDEGDWEYGFHYVQNDGATGKLFGQMAVDTVADGIYHLGFDICDGQFLNEDGNPNAAVADVAKWINSLLKADLAALSPVLVNPAVDLTAEATTGTGLDRLVGIITSDKGLAANIATSEIYQGATAADAMNQIIVEAIRATGVANNGDVNAADVRELNAYIQLHYAAEWAALHGDDACRTEYGFHYVQDDGASSKLFGQMAIDTVADGIYHMGFDICDDQFLNEDGDPNATVADVAKWINTLVKADLAAGTLINLDVDPYAEGTTGTGLDRLVSVITTDKGLNAEISTGEIYQGATAADAMSQIIVEAIRATGVANNGDISAADVRDLNAYIQLHYAAAWSALHGDDECEAESGFHYVQDDGATSKLFGQMAIDTVADGIYHMGFDICDDQFLNEDGDPNATVADVAKWINTLVKVDLAAGTLINLDVDPYAEGTTGTGLDKLASLITTDKGLIAEISTTEIWQGATAADAMNQIIVEAIRATGAANNGKIDTADVVAINGYIQDNFAEQWQSLHGDDECEAESGFHFVQDDGATGKLYGQMAIDTVADGIYHLGFDICDGRLLNEDGDPNASLGDVAKWLNSLLKLDLADGSLVGGADIAGVDGAALQLFGAGSLAADIPFV